MKFLSVLSKQFNIPLDEINPKQTIGRNLHKDQDTLQKRLGWLQIGVLERWLPCDNDEVLRDILNHATVEQMTEQAVLVKMLEGSSIDDAALLLQKRAEQ